MKVLVVAQYVSVHTRVGRLLNQLIESGHDVTLVTANFDHSAKKRNLDLSYFHGVNCIKIEVLGYRKTLGLMRVLSNYIFAKKINKVLNKSIGFDAAVVTVPTAISAKKLSKIAKKKSFPLIMDVLDLWPQALPIPKRLTTVLQPILKIWYKHNENVYKNASGLVSHSKNYLSYLNKLTESKILTRHIPLGCYPSENVAEETKDHSSIITIGYAGNLGWSYDFDTVLEAIAKLNRNSQNKIHLKLIGDGERREELLKKAKEHGVDLTVTGIVPHNSLLKCLSECSIGIIPFRKDTIVSWPYKVNDYLSVGIPIVCSIEGEVGEILIEEKAGIVYEAGSSQDLTSKLSSLLSSVDLQNKMKKNALNLANRLEVSKVYQSYVDFLVEVVRGGSS
ncbi:glycosyltransferase family 4 protein [Paenibacillus filicis]|uniref:Glycosyltransferase family 4 protein n=1 Tax=Paenibacillus filicis TaxID=669464 RepID=A0ABU9DFS0_9BACL